MDITLPPGIFYGERGKSREAIGFRFVESIFAEGAHVPSHEHEHAFFYFVLDGACVESCGTRLRSSEPSALIFHPPAETHSNGWPAGGRCLHIEIERAMLERVRAYAPILDGPAECRGGLPAWLASRLYQELGRDDALSLLAMEGLALELLAAVSRAPGTVAERHPPRWLRQARDLLRSQFTESPTLAGVAGAVGVHPSHLARVFRQYHGCTLGDYVRQLRVEFACQQIGTSDAPLIEIALTAGFSDQSHFTKAFRRLMGVSPGDYRRHLRPRNSDTRK